MLPSINSVGADWGKPIAPQTASVGVSTQQAVRRAEGQVIRQHMGWTLIMLAYLILIVLLFYYVFPKSHERSSGRDEGGVLQALRIISDPGSDLAENFLGNAWHAPQTSLPYDAGGSS